MKCIAGVVCYVLLALVLSACMQTDGAVSGKPITAVHSEIAHIQQQLSMPAVRMEPGYYVDSAPLKKSTDTWLSKQVSMQAKQMPFAQLLGQLLRHQSLVVRYQEGVDQTRLLSLQYTGTLQGALDRLAAQSHYAYAIEDGVLEWVLLQTKTFNIAFMPGTSDYLIGQTASADRMAQGSVNSNANMVTTQGHLYDAQYSNLQASLSVWKDLKAVLDQIKSTQGKVMVSEATTTVTVQDYPDHVAAMGRYIKALNQRLAQQVNVKIKVLNIELNDEYNYGINWDMVQHIAGSKIHLLGALANATNLAATSVASTAASSGLTTLSIGSTPDAVINALSEQGKISVVTEPEVTTMNNQIAEVRITRDTGYLQSVSSTTVANEGTTTSLTPGVVTDGFSLYLLPKVHQRDVYLQISSTLSMLTQLVQVSNAATGGSNSNVQAIQVPTLSEKHFNQRTRIPSGQTLVITGFKQAYHQIKQSAPFGVSPLGGIGAEHKNIQTLVLMTPTIIENAD